MGIRSVAVYSDADAGARHVQEADEAVRVDSYLSIESIVAAARATGAEAVHPGYGFLAENAAFARACAEAGLVFIGPPASAIDAMGDKIRAKQTVGAAGVPVVPGRSVAGMSDDDLVEAAAEVGYPVLVKPSAGGGGKGMRLVEHAEDLRPALESARREARGAFGDDTLLIERFVTSPRHIEIQVLADAHGTVIHLGERECSLQRRHQKIIEEAPSPLLDEAARARMGAAAVDAARAVGYAGAGTVEFIVSADRPDEFFFMEMNTRLQVEHPVTELVTGIDLVEQQLRVAAGQPLGIAQSDVDFDGHAVEARVYAEDPARGFLPDRRHGARRSPSRPAPACASTRRCRRAPWSAPSYDPMLAKVIAWGAGPRRRAAQAVRRARRDRRARRRHQRRVPARAAGRRGRRGRPPRHRARRAQARRAGRRSTCRTSCSPPPRWTSCSALQPTGDRSSTRGTCRTAGGSAGGGGTALRLACGGREVTVRVTGPPADALVSVGGAEPVRASARLDRRPARADATPAAPPRSAARSPTTRCGWPRNGSTWAVAEHSLLEGESADRRRRRSGHQPDAGHRAGGQGRRRRRGHGRRAAGRRRGDEDGAHGHRAGRRRRHRAEGPGGPTGRAEPTPCRGDPT